MTEGIPIIDVWTQFLTGTPPGVNPEGENVFRNYGMLEVFHHGTDAAQMVAAMDRSGVRVALMAGDNAAVAEKQNRFPGRIYGEYHADPRHIMKAVRELDHYVRSCGFVALRVEPFMWRKAPTDRSYYPLYAKAAELGSPGMAMEAPLSSASPRTVTARRPSSSSFTEISAPK